MDIERVKLAVAGNKEAMEEVLQEHADFVFNLCLRMLGDIDDAKDASQEIYMKIIANLPSFRMESKVSTWIYRIAVNYLLRHREKRNRFAQLNFEIYEADLIPEHFDVPYDESVGAESELAKELKFSCSNVMLQCMDAKSRCVFVLSTMFHVPSKTGAEIMDISYDNYRQILSRSKRKMRTFLAGFCMMHGNCECKRRIGHAIRTHRINPEHLAFSSLQVLDDERIAAHTSKMEALEDESDFFKFLPNYQAKEVLSHVVEELTKG